MQKLPEYDSVMEEKRREADAANEVCRCCNRLQAVCKMCLIAMLSKLAIQ